MLALAELQIDRKLRTSGPCPCAERFGDAEHLALYGKILRQFLRFGKEHNKKISQSRQVPRKQQTCSTRGCSWIWPCFGRFDLVLFMKETLLRFVWNLQTSQPSEFHCITSQSPFNPFLFLPLIISLLPSNSFHSISFHFIGRFPLCPKYKAMGTAIARIGHLISGPIPLGNISMRITKGCEMHNYSLISITKAG